MEATKFTKQALGFQRTIFDNSFNAMTMIQDHTERMMNGYLDQLPWVTPEGKKSLQTSIDMAKRMRDDFKKSIDDGYGKMEEIL